MSNPKIVEGARVVVAQPGLTGWSNVPIPVGATGTVTEPEGADGPCVSFDFKSLGVERIADDETEMDYEDPIYISPALFDGPNPYLEISPPPVATEIEIGSLVEVTEMVYVDGGTLSVGRLGRVNYIHRGDAFVQIEGAVENEFWPREEGTEEKIPLASLRLIPNANPA